MSDAPVQPPPQRKPDPRPKRFMGIELTWKLPQFITHGLPWKIQRYLHKTAAAGALDRDAIMELADHFRTGLAQKRSPDDLIKALGPPDALGSAIGRARRPIRWFFARANIWFGRGLIAFLVLYFTLWLCLSWSKPHPTVDYYARLDASTSNTPPETHAWPIYRQLLQDPRLRHEALSQAIMNPNFGLYDLPIQPGDDAWPQARAYLLGLQPQLAQLREASAKPNLGMILRPTPQLSHDDQKAIAHSQSPAPMTPPPVSNDPVCRLVAAQFNESQWQLPAIRNLYSVLPADMNLAAEQSDAPRLIADFDALMALRKQIAPIQLPMARYFTFHGPVTASNRISQLALTYPNLFTESQIADLRRKIAHETNAWDSLPFPENYTLEDRIQRVYASTDDNAELTYTGLLYLTQSVIDPEKNQPIQPPSIAARVNANFFFPLVYLFFPSPKSFREEEAKNQAANRLDAVTPWSTDFASAHARGVKLQTPGIFDVYRRMLDFSMGADQTTNRTLGHYQASNKASCRTHDTLLAIAQYRARHGRYPAAPSDLVPEFLSSIPTGLDPKETLIFKTTPQNLFTVYSPGPNGIDDGGIPVAPSDLSWHPSSNKPAPPGDTLYFPLHGHHLTPSP